MKNYTLQRDSYDAPAPCSLARARVRVDFWILEKQQCVHERLLGSQAGVAALAHSPRTVPESFS